MKYIFEFAVDLKASKAAATGDARIVSQTLFERLRGQYPDSSINPRWFLLRVSREEALRTRLFEEIEADGGKKPVADLGYATNHADEYYAVRVERILEPEELDQGPWLYLTVPKLSLAEFKAVSSDDTYTITKVIDRKGAYGCTRTVGWMMLFSEKLRNSFLEAGLRNVEFRPVTLDKGGPSGLWQVWNTVRMPPLQAKLLNGRHEPYDGDPSKGCMIGEGRYTWPVLRYRAQDMEALEPTDLALTAERFGWPAAHNWHRHYVVSQQFRRVAEKLAPGLFSYGMVAVGEGEELRQRYTVPELAPPAGL